MAAYQWMPIPTNMMKAQMAWTSPATRRRPAEKAGANQGCQSSTPVRSRRAMIGTIDQNMSFWPALYLWVVDVGVLLAHVGPSMFFTHSLSAGSQRLSLPAPGPRTGRRAAPAPTPARGWRKRMNCPPPKSSESQKKNGRKSASPERKRKMKAMATAQWVTRGADGVAQDEVAVCAAHGFTSSSSRSGTSSGPWRM